MSNAVAIKDKYASFASTYEADVARMGWSGPAMVVEELAPHVKDGQRIYEVGIGSGLLARQFLNVADVEIGGCDLSPQMLNLCANSGTAPARNLSLVDLNIEDIPEPSGCVQHVISCAVLEYIDNLGHALSEISRLAASGSHIVLLYEGCKPYGRHEVEGQGYTYFHHSHLEVEEVMIKNDVRHLFHEALPTTVNNGNPIHYTLYHGVKL